MGPTGLKNYVPKIKFSYFLLKIRIFCKICFFRVSVFVADDDDEEKDENEARSEN